MKYAQRLADAVARSKTSGALSLVSNPLDVQRFAIHWLLDELDAIELRLSKAEGKIALMQGDGK